MKNNKFILTVSLAALTFLAVGCYSLEQYPNYQLSDGTFWKNEQQAKEAVIGVYSMLQNKNVCGELYLEDAIGSIGVCSDHSICDVINGTYGPTSSFVTDKWTNLYEGVARANLVLRHVPEMTSISDESKVLFIAEARFLRAFFYNMLMNYWGAVPYYDQTWVIGEKFAEMKEPRMGVEQLRENILADLDYAIAFLPDEWPSSDYGRATNGAAQALKAKVLLYNKQYYDAALLFEDLIFSGKYGLDSTYSDIFKPSGDSGKEMIFTVQNQSMCANMGNLSSYGSGSNRFTLAPEFVDTYDLINGKAFDWDCWFDGFTTDNEVKEETFLLRYDSTCEDPIYPYGYRKLLLTYNIRDSRMESTVILPYHTYNGWYGGKTCELEYLVPSTGTGNESYGSLRVNNDQKAYLFRKFVPEGNADGINFPIIRYADVLLMYAECLNEIGYQATALKYINQVRSRADMSSIYITDKDLLFEAIRHERECELAGEGHSYMDLKRWGLLEELDGKAVTNIIGETQYVHKVSSRDYLLPIPAKEIKLNPQLTQNPDW